MSEEADQITVFNNCLDQQVRDIKKTDFSESTPSSVCSESGESEAV